MPTKLLYLDGRLGNVASPRPTVGPDPPRQTSAGGSRRDSASDVIFQGRSTAAFQRMDDTFVNYVAAINMADRSLTLTKSADKKWKADFTFEQPDAES